MKYETKFDIGQEVCVLYGKGNKIIQDKIYRVRIENVGPYFDGDKNEESNGVKIDYCICVEPRDVSKNRYHWQYEWFKEENICLTKEELIRKIQ